MDRDGDIPMPINSSYGGRAQHHHDPHVILPHAAPPPPSQTHIHIPSSNGNGNGGGDGHHHKKAAAATHHHVVGGVTYRECLKNHAAAVGGNATDGCGEFMPSGDEGSMEALTCSACICHRNFHRKEIEGQPPTDHFYQYRLGRSKVILAAGGQHHPHKTSNMLLPPPPEAFGYPTAAAAEGTLVHSRAGGGITSHGGQMIMSYNMQPAVSAVSDDQEEEHEDRYGRRHDHRQVGKMKKRFRTKFTQEQKEKMFDFAEGVGWKIQKQEEGVVQQLCQELGIKRRVLKVWMHNNKHNLATKNKLPTTAPAADGQLA